MAMAVVDLVTAAEVAPVAEVAVLAMVLAEAADPVPGRAAEAAGLVDPAAAVLREVAAAIANLPNKTRASEHDRFEAFSLFTHHFQYLRITDAVDMVAGSGRTQNLERPLVPAVAGKGGHRMRNAQQLRHAIDSGRTGDKVAFPDPAAAPLGTDDEAAGTPPTPEQVEMAWEAENKQSRSGPVYSDDEVRQGEIILKQRWQRIVFIGGLAGAVLLAAVLAFASPWA
jgi:hypothetical protein